MRSIRRRFEEEIERDPFHSSFMCFGAAVRHQSFSRKKIRYWFDRLVDKDDYSPCDANVLVGNLYRFSNEPEEGTFLGKKRPSGE